MRKGMTIRLGLAAAAMLLAAVTPANALVQYSPYKPKGITGDGYRDVVIAAGRWRITGYTEFDTTDKGVKIAVYRGALLAKANGFPFLQIVDGRIIESVTVPLYVKSDMTMVGLRSADAPAKCEAKPKFAVNCRVLEVEDTIASYGKALYRSPEQREVDLEAVRNLPFKN